MFNEKLVRLLIFIFAAALHLVVIFFVVIDTSIIRQEESEHARLMRLIDFEELPPPPEPEPEIPVQEIITVEEIAEVMIETDTAPVQEVVAAGTLSVTTTWEDDFLPMHLLSTPPQFDGSAIAADLVFPPIALRAGIEGRVILEVLVDRTGAVQRVIVLRETPEGRGFGEAAARAYMGRQGTPATVNGEPVSARVHIPVVFQIR